MSEYMDMVQGHQWPKATTELGVLDALQGVRWAQDYAGKAEGPSALRIGLQGLYRHYGRLPESVTSRLTALDPELVQRIPEAATDELTELAASLAAEEAVAQVLRAVNHYRTRRGYPPLNPDGSLAR